MSVEADAGGALSHRGRSLSRALPWLVVVLSVCALGIRTWRRQAATAEQDEYFFRVLALWRRDSAAILVSGAALSILPVRPDASRLERLGWALAIWSAFVACVLPRPGNFWANGGADDEILVYLPAGILAIAIAWILSRWSMGWLQFWTGLSIVSAIGACVFTAQDGYGAEEVFFASAISAAAAGALALGTALVQAGARMWRSRKASMSDQQR